ncbi:hypothetical protein [Lysobacter gummosus]
MRAACPAIGSNEGGLGRLRCFCPRSLQEGFSPDVFLSGAMKLVCS